MKAHFIVLVLFLTIWKINSQNTVSGVIFRDYNWNGIRDLGEPAFNGQIEVGVSIRPSSSSSPTVLLQTINQNGQFNFNLPDDTVDFELSINPSSIPSPYFYGVAKSNHTISELTFGTAPVSYEIPLSSIEDFCATNADDINFVINCYVFGNQQTANPQHNDVLVSFPFRAGNNIRDLLTPAQAGVPAPKSLAKSYQIGTTWGLAYQRSRKQLFAASFIKRHSGLASNSNADTGLIFRIDMNQDPAVSSVAINLEPFVNTGGSQVGVNGAHDLNNYVSDNQAWDHVGKYGLGGMTIDSRDQFLYVISLFSKELVKINIQQTPPVIVSKVAVPNPIDCPAQDVRPFSVVYKNGRLFVGLVCSAELSQDVSRLRAYVFTANPTNLVFTGPILQFPLNYRRGIIAPTGNSSTCTVGNRLNEPLNYNLADWRPWVNVDSEYPVNAQQCFYPQPILSDIDFSHDGNQMLLAFTDRYGHQSGNAETNPPVGDVNGVSAGDLLCAYFNGLTWNLESNANCGPLRGGVSYTSVLFNNFNPTSTTEFFSDDYFASVHSEVIMGGIASITGVNTVLAAAYDPLPNGVATSFRTGGIRYFNTSNGALSQVYVVYQQDMGNNTFGKATGLGDIVPLCEPPPLQIGNRLWFDSNFDGNQDIGEIGIPNIPIQLYLRSDRTLIATTITDQNGEWYFGNNDGLLPDTQYFVSIRKGDIDNFFGCTCSFLPPAFLPSVGTFKDSNAIIDPSSAMNYIAYVNTGTYGFVDHSIDLGVSQLLALGDFVWCDRDANGRQDVNMVQDEVGIPNVVVMLIQNGTVINTTTTDQNGLYRFYVRPRQQYSLAIDLQNNEVALGECFIPTLADAPGVPSALNSDGIVTTFQGRQVTFDTINMGIAPVLTIDFGFRRQIDIGDFLWFDENTNGLQDANEIGLPNVQVTLMDTSLNFITTFTNQSGYYLFPNVDAHSNYEIYVQLDGINSDTFSNLQPTRTFAGSSLLDSNGLTDDLVINGVSIPVSIANVLTFADTDLSIDFGFQLKNVKLGDFVWVDTNENGIQDQDEVGIPGVTVQLINSTGFINATVTDENGYYLFSVPINNDYTVRILTQNGFLGDLVPTFANIGNDSMDSDGVFNAQTNFVEVTVSIGVSEDLTIDFGFRPTQNIGDYVWCDENRNGQQDPTELPLPGVVVSLLNSSNAIISTTTTNSTGQYEFVNLPPNTIFRVVIFLTQNEQALMGKIPSRPFRGDYETDSNGISGIVANLTASYYDVLVGIVNNYTIDFGFYTPPPSCNYTTYLYNHKVKACFNETRKNHSHKEKEHKSKENNKWDDDQESNGWIDSHNDVDVQKRSPRKTKRVVKEKEQPKCVENRPKSDFDVCSGPVAKVTVYPTSNNLGTCISVEPTKGINFGRVDYLALSGIHNPTSVMSQIINVTSNGVDVTPGLYIQNFEDGARVCDGETPTSRLCMDYNPEEDPLHPIKEGDIVFCFACTEFDLSVSPINICFANVRPYDFTLTSFKLKASEVNGTCDTQINAYGVLPTRCDNSSTCLDGNIVCDVQCKGRLPITINVWNPEIDVVCMEIRQFAAESIGSLEYFSFVGKNQPLSLSEATVDRALDGYGNVITDKVSIERFTGDRACVARGGGCIGFDTNMGLRRDINEGDINVCLSCHPYDRIAAPVQICFREPGLSLTSFNHTILKLQLKDVCGFCGAKELRTVAVLQNNTCCNDMLWTNGVLRSYYDSKVNYFPEKDACCVEKEEENVWDKEPYQWAWGGSAVKEAKKEQPSNWWEEPRWKRN